MLKNKKNVENTIIRDTSYIDGLIHESSKKTETDLITSLKMLINNENLEGKTILDNRQVTAITLMNWAGQVYDIPFLNDFVDRWVRYRISGDKGRGRDDIIRIAEAIQRNRDVEHDKLKEIMGLVNR